MLLTMFGIAWLAGPGLIVGPVFVLLGANSCIRALVAVFKKPDGRSKDSCDVREDADDV